MALDSGTQIFNFNQIQARNIDVTEDFSINSVEINDYITSRIGVHNAMTYKGSLSCSGSPNFPAANAGDVYLVSSAGRLGGSGGLSVEISDLAICKTDLSPAGDYATVGANWDIIQGNLTLAHTNTFYVDGSRTDTYTPDGNILRPFLTVKAAVDHVKTLYTAATDKQLTRYTIKIAPGTYSTAFEITTIKHLRLEGIGVTLSGAITLTTTPIGGSGQEPYCRLEFIGHNGIRAEKGSPMKISGAITGTRTNDSLNYINFDGCWITGNQLYETDGTWVTHYNNCRVEGTIDTGTFATADSTVLIETTGWNEFTGAITDKVTFYNINNTDFYGAITTTPIFDCTLVNTRFIGNAVSIIAAKNLYADLSSMKSLYDRTPTLTGMTIQPLDGIAMTKVPISAAQIIGMKDAPVTLIPAVTGKTIVVDSIEFKIDTTATQFANGTDAEIHYTNLGGAKITADIGAALIRAGAGTTYQILKPVNTILAGAVSSPVILTNQTTAYDTGTGTITASCMYHLI